MELPILLFCSIGSAIASYSLFQLLLAKKSNARLPPGPPGLPFIGNVRDFPPAGVPEYEHWETLRAKYGPVIYLSAIGSGILVIQDRKAVFDLMERASLKTSDRPGAVFANKLCGYEHSLISKSYTDDFRLQRKLIHQVLGTKKLAAQFRDIQEHEVHFQLLNSIESPEKWLAHLRSTVSATTLKMVYGYSIERNKPDHVIQLIEKAGKQFSLAAVPMSWAVDIFPILQYLPENFPGASFQKTAKYYKRCIEATNQTPYLFVRDRMAQGSFEPCHVSKLLERYDSEAGESPMTTKEETAIIWTASTLYGAGSDTTLLVLTIFTLAMTKYPDIQRKAQEEIDRVVGMGRLPTFSDRENLPYINALIKELLRWWPIVPLSFPHQVSQDIEYDGMHIPKGTIIITNLHWFLHDPEVYPDPEAFDPERFLSRNEPDPDLHVFGYGRRICPGRHFADAGIFINITNSLATLNFNKALGKDGKEIEVNAAVTSGLVGAPTDFQFRVSSRGPEYEERVRKLGLEVPTSGQSHLLKKNLYDVTV